MSPFRHHRPLGAGSFAIFLTLGPLAGCARAPVSLDVSPSQGPTVRATIDPITIARTGGAEGFGVSLGSGTAVTHARRRDWPRPVVSASAAQVLATAEREDAVLDYCIRQHIPVVTVNRGEETGRVSCVVSDNLLAMRLTVDHLVGLGHRHIGHIAGPAALSTGFLRREGFVQAVRRHRLRRDAWHVIEAASYSREAGKLACAQLLEAFPAVTAIAAGNDLVAMGCYDLLRERGLDCPADISVVENEELALKFTTYFQTPQSGAIERMKLFKLAWDMVGSEFAGRHLQYEKFYAGAQFIIRNHSYRETDWGEFDNLVDDLMASYDYRKAQHIQPPRLSAVE